MNKFSGSKEPKMVTNTEEFSFPVMSNPLANFMLSSSSSSSSSLWRISSRVFHHHEEEKEKEEEEEEEDCRMDVRSMCELGFSPGNKREIECASCQGEELETEMGMEERMDYLWEDFNEEDKFDHDHHVRDQAKNANKEIWVFQGLPKLGRNRTRTRRPTSMLVIDKLFKGLLSIRKSAQQKIMKSRF